MAGSEHQMAAAVLGTIELLEMIPTIRCCQVIILGLEA